MNPINPDSNTYRLPGQLTPFQKEFYIHLIDWKWEHITKEPGLHYRNGQPHEYDAILPDFYIKNAVWPHIYPGVEQRLRDHQTSREHGFKLHKHFYHMASSQAANANLFLPILEYPLADTVLNRLKPDLKSIAHNKLDHGYKLEYWGNDTELLHDHTPYAGTDADLAIAYYNHQDELCLWLIEHKLTEKEFTKCGGFESNKEKKRDGCNCASTFAELIRDYNRCYYHRACGYYYWNITDHHAVFFPNHNEFEKCPFKGGMNQLWRNQLLGLAIEDRPDFPYEHVYFSVVRHPRNTDLLPTLGAYTRLIGNHPKFSAFTSKDVLTSAATLKDPDLNVWIGWYKDLYMI